MSYFYDNAEIQEKAVNYHHKRRNRMFVLQGVFAFVVVALLLVAYLNDETFEMQWWVPLVILGLGAGLPFLITMMNYRRKMKVFEGQVKEFAFVGSKYSYYPYMVFHPDTSEVKMYMGPTVGRSQRRLLRKPLIGYYVDQEVAKFAGMIYPERKDKSERMTGFCHVCGKVNQDAPEVCKKCGCELMPDYFE